MHHCYKAGVTGGSSPVKTSTSGAIESNSSVGSHVPSAEDTSISESAETHLLNDPSNADIFNGFEKLIEEVTIQSIDFNRLSAIIYNFLWL